MKRDIRILLHNIRSSHNVGSIFRTSDAGGVTHIYLSGYTPTPVNQFGKVNHEIAKTGLGAHESVAWSKTSAQKVIRELKKEGFTVIGLEQDSRAVHYKKIPKARKVLLLVGNEVQGLSPSLKQSCDVLGYIPMQGSKESLNVSVAFGIGLFQLL